MSRRNSTRRHVLEAATAVFGAAVLGCQDRSRENTERAKVPTRGAQVAGIPTPTLGWEVVASGNDGPGKRSRHGLVYDSSAKAAILFGGVVWKPDWSLQADTWELHGRTWTRIRTSESPPARHRGAMVYMDGHQQSLLFGGQGDTYELLGDTWTYSVRRWRRVRPGVTAPSPRCGHCIAFDEQAEVAVLFGGVDAGMKSLGDTWLFDGTSWKRVHGSNPPARRYAALAYAPDLKGCLLHGGSDDESGNRSFGDAWLLRENTWERLGVGFRNEAPGRS